MTIPAQVHFCWIGPRTALGYVFAVLSAVERGGMTDVILHHTDALDHCPELNALRDAPGVTLQRIDAVACLTDAGSKLNIGDALAALYGRVGSPTMRADILRAAILYLQGGIYLDLDTITVRSLRPLLKARQFVGCEYIVWPHLVRTSWSPVRWARSIILDVLRKGMRRMPNGWRYFRRVERLYYRGVNNAVMGAEPGTPLFARYLRAMAAISPERLNEPYALGPDMLQDLIAETRDADLVVHDPHVFYPLPPEISEHWFRPGDTVKLYNALSTETRVVHWYASVHTKSRVAAITPAFVSKHWQSQLYSALVCSSISNLPGTTDSMAPSGARPFSRPLLDQAIP